MRSEFKGHMRTETFSMVDRVSEGRKAIGSKWCFDYKTGKKGNITKFKTGWLPGDSCRFVTWITPTNLPPARNQHPLSW